LFHEKRQFAIGSCAPIICIISGVHLRKFAANLGPRPEQQNDL
jgi:hypothetical protein